MLLEKNTPRTNMATSAYTVSPVAGSILGPCTMYSLPSSMNGLLEEFRRLIFSKLTKVATAFVRNREKKMSKVEVIQRFLCDCDGTKDYNFWKSVCRLSNKISCDPRYVTPNEFLAFGETISASRLDYADTSRRIILGAYFNIIELILRRYPQDVHFNNMKDKVFEAMLLANPLLNTEEGNNE